MKFGLQEILYVWIPVTLTPRSPEPNQIQNAWYPLIHPVWGGIMYTHTQALS